MITISAKCTALTSDWSPRLLTKPSLPVDHDTSVTLKCKRGSILDGPKEALCNDGQLEAVPTPVCKGISGVWECVIEKMWGIFLICTGYGTKGLF